MIIDKLQLISLLEEKTGLDRERVEDQLSELVKRILKAAEEDKSFEIEGFGTFSMKEDKLRFEPSDMLKTEINNKYAGMKPIELMGAFKEPDGGEVPAIDIDEKLDDAKDKVWAFDKDSAEKKEASEKSVPESRKEQADGQEESKELSEPTEEQKEPVLAEESAEEIFDLPASREDEIALPEFPAEKEAEPEDETSQVVPLEEAEEEKDIMSQLLVAAVVIIAIGLSGWVAYDTELIGTEEDSTENIRQAEQSTSQQSENIQEASSLGTSSQNSEDNNSSEPEEELAVGTEEDLQPIRESEEESTFGLTGDVNKTINGGYTIVVHSLRSMQQAEDRKENLQDSGYRTLISKADVQGTTYFRVGLGQFETVDDALEAVSDIPVSFQRTQNHFIKRIQ